MALEPDEPKSTLSGLTASEAREFNRIFLLSFIGFILLALLAHILAWFWRPWGIATPYVTNTGWLLDGPGAVAHAKLALNGIGAPRIPS